MAYNGSLTLTRNNIKSGTGVPDPGLKGLEGVGEKD
jgi:hypothetical protein